ncbi:uncharacterized protein LOC118669062 isoform X1 [Myotis myotis]|uniref:uncharacterized protein LOC118669062 isoform X1 n=1 Tax=Myotis myotis TaxID=51298 RepID=UPI00174CF3F3|nr:uncharacterized protein LOC118669062 isoform X1 [Myotis myotis]
MLPWRSWPGQKLGLALCRGQGDPGLVACDSWGVSWGRRNPECDPAESEVRPCPLKGVPLVTPAAASSPQGLERWHDGVERTYRARARRGCVIRIGRLPRNLWGLKPVVSTEAPPIIFATPTKLTSDYPTYDYAGKNKVPELQKFFQKSDGVPIHLKRGLPDQMLYRTTMALTLGGTIYCLIALYMASQPRNK